LEPETNSRVGRFRILEPLGSGGAHDVFLAEDEAGARVVLKILAAPERNQGLFDPRIADEVSTYASLQHPNIVKVLDLFSTEGQFVIALEWVDGAPLSVVRAAFKSDSAAPFGDFAALYVSAAVFSALAAAHEAFDAVGRPAPVVHRNVNPSNVHVLWDGTVKLGNFNVANVVTVLRDSSPGFTWGSYGYFAPEQVKLQEVGPAADVYAASLVLWELLAGRKALERGTMTDFDLLTAMATPKIPLLETLRTDLDRRLFDAVRIGLEVDPARRTLNAAQMRDLLTELVDVSTERTRLAAAIARVRPVVEHGKLPPKTRPTPPKASPSKLPVESTPPGQVEPPWGPASAPDPFKAPVPEVAAPPPPVRWPAPLVEVIAPIEPLHGGDAVSLESTVFIRRRRSSLPLVLAVCGGLAMATVVGVFVARSEGSSAPGAVVVATPAASSAASSPSPVADPLAAAARLASTSPSVEPASSSPAPPAPEPSAVPSDHGELRFPPYAAGHRIFVDGRVVGDGAQPATVRCGTHEVRIGSAGAPQQVDVPCGGSITLSR
jgi:eukaryotic-like serine/threonine-protein kinase